MLGKQFGQLTVIAVGKGGRRGNSWICQCSCGSVLNFAEVKLTKYGRESCGCSRNKSTKTLKTPWGSGVKEKLTYDSWKNMIGRCDNPKKARCYIGIDVCDEWRSFAKFLEDMGRRPSKEYSVDRIDPDKGYCPENCRWLLTSENCSRARRVITEERNKKLSESLRRAHAEGRIVITDETRRKIGEGGKREPGEP